MSVLKRLHSAHAFRLSVSDIVRHIPDDRPECLFISPDLSVPDLIPPNRTGPCPSSWCRFPDGLRA